MIILIKIFSPDGRAGGRDGTGRDGRRAGATGKHKKKHLFIEKSIFSLNLLTLATSRRHHEREHEISVLEPVSKSKNSQTTRVLNHFSV